MSRETKKEIVFRQDSTAILRTIFEETLAISETMVAHLAESYHTPVHNLFRVNGKPVNARIGSGGEFYTVTLDRLALKCRWRLVNGEPDLWVPNIGSNIDPIVTLYWVPPGTMQLLMLIKSIQGVFKYAWLVAINQDQADTRLRLPLGNIFEDCKLCLGDNSVTGSTVEEMILNAIQVLEASEWNTDLWTHKSEETQKLFRFRPNPDKGFTQLEPDGDWRSMCKTVANDNLNQILL